MTAFLRIGEAFSAVLIFALHNETFPEFFTRVAPINLIRFMGRIAATHLAGELPAGDLPCPTRMTAPRFIDSMVAVCMRDVDRTLLRKNLKLTPEQRLQKFLRFASFAETLRKAGRRSRAHARKKR